MLCDTQVPPKLWYIIEKNNIKSHHTSCTMAAKLNQQNNI